MECDNTLDSVSWAVVGPLSLGLPVDNVVVGYKSEPESFPSISQLPEKIRLFSSRADREEHIISEAPFCGRSEAQPNNAQSFISTSISNNLGDITDSPVSRFKKIGF